tara:strand:+ start:2708 stop:3085 length:378 start_codon:yes stop_codon:yes gene_type:complete
MDETGKRAAMAAILRSKSVQVPQESMNDFVSRVPGRSGRAYIGYEDPSPMGRAAINEFNKNGGSSLLSTRDPISPYMQAVQKAYEAAVATGDQQQQEYLSALMTINPTATPPSVAPVTYSYPPKN